MLEKYLSIHNVIALFLLTGLGIAAIRTKAFSSALNAFDNRDNGYSGRKLTAFGFSVLTYYVESEGFARGIIDKSNILEVIITNICVVLLALALIKFDDLPKILNAWKGKKEEEQPKV